MEIVFQNKIQDLDAIYAYMVKETEEGRRVSKQLFRTGLIWDILICLLLGFFFWVLYDSWLVGIGTMVFMFMLREALKLMLTKFQPLYIPAIEFYKKQEKLLTPRDLQVFQLSRTLTIDEKWLEVRSSEAVHRWRWRQVDRIEVFSDFIFIQIGSCSTVYIPKRDFQSEQSFIEFGKKLIEFQETNKDQPIGGE
jgi:hypothetical protein